MFQVIETNRMIHLVLEVCELIILTLATKSCEFPCQFCPGGELFDYIVAKERLTVSWYYQL